MSRERAALLRLSAATVLIALLAWASPALAGHFDIPPSLNEVITTSPAWDKFTNQDGTGLYHEVLAEVFGLYGMTVRHWYAPSIRAKDLVRMGKADMMTCTDRGLADTILAETPLYEGSYHAFFKVNRIGPWAGDASLHGRVVVARVSYYIPENFSVPVVLREVSSGTAGLGMVLLGRADFYVDDKALIEQSIRETDISFNPELYDIRPVGTRALRPLVPDSPRGHNIMRLYDAGMETLKNNGTLERIYKKWGFDLPGE